ncbi:hypothetical protein TPHA_0E03410 [Tetrapisispora phaffii CBS 4417]|uniref:Autophagy-related protein 27 n=1 Tax=Tetrapisispora phaffii (strain ATCC 24235 / CBS 4417 / NBRC 1672 / NRRL Y-8282 / UCD 70-5) TaxID=1071381 RepID=G8BU53_TETPH|nr:hypothetical protein TPHA_0E03410 [Tetrapisispora phaffii CBS 4417]CCE63431.1 hypothetical protein TPHA_0E03410 [Tetrapisispora phaffii CBS 4417]
MKVYQSFFALVLLSSFVLGLQCSKHEVLKLYDLDKSMSLSELEKETPPTTTVEKWYINICNEDNGKNSKELYEGCKKTDLMCGVRLIKSATNKNDSPLLAQLIDIDDSSKLEVSVVDNNLSLQFKDVVWGPNKVDASVVYTCDKNMKVDEVTSVWLENNIQVSIKGPSGCLKDNNKDSDNNNSGNNGENNEKQSSGFPWFMVMLMYVIVFTVVYVSVMSYKNTRGGSFNEFSVEFIERFTQLITSLPDLLKEVVSKIFGSRSSTERGGYSVL